jgi:hypothetical protein
LSACGSGASQSFETNAPAGPDGITLSIDGPTSLPVIETVDPKVTISGTAYSDNGISEITWTNDRGGSGVAAGTEYWEIGNIHLKIGENTIEVVATDNDGTEFSQIIVVKRETEGTGSVTLNWIPPTLRIDGTPLTNLAGYTILYGRMSGIYDYQIDIRNPGIVTYVVENLVPGDWYFAVVAFDTDDIESDRSQEAHRHID